MWSIGFGLERIGLAAVARPLTTLLLLAVVVIAAASGLPKLKPDDALSDLFRSGTPAYADYRLMRERFPSSELDLLVVAQSEQLLTPETLEALRSLHLDLELTGPVAGVLSPFSMRRRPPPGGLPSQLFPDELPDANRLPALVEEALDHPFIKDSLLARRGKNGGIALIIVSLDQAAVAAQGLEAVVGIVDRSVHTSIGSAPIRTRITGVPALQMEIREAIRRDRVIYNLVGFAIGFLISLFVFRRFDLVLLTSIAPAASVLIGLGALGHAGFRLNTLVNVIPPLVLVIAFSDSMHLVDRIRREILSGHDARTAARIAVAGTGPACALTSLTTAASMLSLFFSSSALIRDFGLASGFVTMLAYFVVIALVPALAVLVFGDGSSLRRARALGFARIPVLEAPIAWTRYAAATAPGTIALLGTAAIIACACLHLALEPRYRLSDQVPTASPAVAASQLVDATFHAAHPLHVMIEQSPADPDPARAIDAEVHDVLSAIPGLHGFSSRATLDRWLRNGGADSAEADRVRALMPERVLARMENSTARASLVTAYMGDLPASEARALVARVDAALAAVRARHPTVRLVVTGLPAVAAIESTSMIQQLNFNLLGSMIVVIAMIGVAFRSASFAVLAILPNVFPIVAAGAILFALDKGLEYASVVALVVAFGIAVDDSIHYLNHLRSEQAQGRPLADAALAALERIGPLLILTTCVLVAGMSATIFSDLPPMRLFGLLMMGALVAALLSDILLLPALIVWWGRWRDKASAGKAPALAAR